MGKSTSDKLWYIKIESGAAFLFKGGKRVPNFKNIVGSAVIEQPMVSTSASATSSPATKKLVTLEFTPSANDTFKFASLNPRYFNQFECDGEFISIQDRTADSLAEKVRQILEELNAEEPAAVTAPITEREARQVPTGLEVREKPPLTPLFSSSKKKKTESSHVKGIQDRCSTCLVDNKAQFIQIDQLVVPPKNRQIRAVDEDFLKQLVENVQSQPEGNYEPLFVLVKGVSSKAEFDQDKSDYEYEVLGGTHLTLATQQLHEKFPDNVNFSGRLARVYVGLTDEEALWLGAMHNNTGAFRHDLKYKDEVMICRSQLFAQVHGDLNEDPPVPTQSWRDVCSSLINKSKRNLSEVFTMAQLPGEAWRHLQTISAMYEKGQLKDQKIKATEIVKKGKPSLKQWQFKSLCSLNCEDQTFLLGKVARKAMSMQELHKAALDIKALKPIQEAIADFFKVQSWEEVSQEFGEDVNAEKLLRFAGKGFEQSHDFQTFLRHLKKLRDGPADGEVGSQGTSFSGQSGAKGLAIFHSSLKDVELSSFTSLPNFGGAFLAVGHAEDARDITEVINLSTRINYTMLTSFNVVIFTTIDNVKETSKKMSEGGATMTQTGHFYVQENSRQTQGPFFNKALTTFVVGHWSVAREVTARHSTYGGDDVILLDKAHRPACQVASKAFSWIVKHLSREGDIVADVNSGTGGIFAAALQQGRNAVWLSTAAPDDQPELLRSLAQDIPTVVPTDVES